MWVGLWRGGGGGVVKRAANFHSPKASSLRFESCLPRRVGYVEPPNPHHPAPLVPRDPGPGPLKMGVELAASFGIPESTGN